MSKTANVFQDESKEQAKVGRTPTLCHARLLGLIAVYSWYTFVCWRPYEALKKETVAGGYDVFNVTQHDASNMPFYQFYFVYSSQFEEKTHINKYSPKKIRLIE